MLNIIKRTVIKLIDLNINVLNDFFSFFDFKVIRLIRSFIFRIFGVNLHVSSYADFGTRFHNARNIFIASGVGIGHYNRFWCFGKIYIGRFCQTALGVTMVAGSHDISSMEPTANADIIIEDFVWLGANCTIVGPSKIGKGAIIGAGSLVIGDIEPMGIYAGIPAKLIRKRELNSEKLIGPRGMLTTSEINEILA